MSNKIYKWLIKNNPYNTNYSDLIVQSIINSAFLKDKVADIFIMFIANVIRIHVDGFLSYLAGPNNYIVHIIVSTILYYLLSIFYYIVSKFRQEIYIIVKYIVSNYNEKIKLWRRYLTCAVCIYIILLTFMINIDNNFIRTCIIEYAIVFLIVEVIEEKYFSSVITRIRNRSSNSQSIWQTNDFDLKIPPNKTRDPHKQDDTQSLLDEVEEVKKSIALEEKEEKEEKEDEEKQLDFPKPIVKKPRQSYVFVSDDFKL